MNRKTFFTAVSVIGFIVSIAALAFPAALLGSKGVVPTEAVVIWLRELGVAIAALSVMLVLVRDLPDSKALRAIVIGNVVLHVGLFPIELIAWSRGFITVTSGVVPNSILHCVVAAGLTWFAVKMKVESTA